MICAIIVIPYYENVIQDAKNVWHIFKYFIYFCWNISPTGTAPNGSHLYLYLPNWQANVVRYDDFSSNFRLWYPELATMIDMYLTLLSLCNMSFNVGPLCMSLTNTWFNHAGSKHNLNHTIGFGY